MKKSHKGTVWITGASKGIGKALVHNYLNDNYRVIASSRSISSDDFSDVDTSLIKSLSLKPFDASLKADNYKIVQEIVAEFGAIDIAILNAGTCVYLTVDSFDSIVFEHLLQQNVLSVVYALEALLPLMKNKQASIAVTGSLVSYGGLPRSSAYGATKAALQNLVQSLQIELHKKPLHLALISPGFVKTPLTDQNDFPMPFLMNPNKAASIIKKGIHKKKLEIHFPLKLSLIMKIIMCLPHKLMTSLIAKGTHKQL